MDTKDVLALGLGVTPPWRLAGQRLDTGRHPHVLEVLLETDRGAELPGRGREAASLCCSSRLR